MAALHAADHTDHTAVIVCKRPGCHWRAFGHTPASTWRLYATHCRRIHDDEKAARYATRRATRRHTPRDAS